MNPYKNSEDTFFSFYRRRNWGNTPINHHWQSSGVPESKATAPDQRAEMHAFNS